MPFTYTLLDCIGWQWTVVQNLSMYTITEEWTPASLYPSFLQNCIQFASQQCKLSFSLLPCFPWLTVRQIRANRDGDYQRLMEMLYDATDASLNMLKAMVWLGNEWDPSIRSLLCDRCSPEVVGAASSPESSGWLNSDLTTSSAFRDYSYQSNTIITKKKSLKIKKIHGQFAKGFPWPANGHS